MENPFEYQDVDGPRVPLFRRPVPIAQHLLSLGLLLFGVFSGFVCIVILVHGLAPGSGVDAIWGAVVGFVAAATGYGLHCDRYWATCASAVFFCVILVGVVIGSRVMGLGVSASLLSSVGPAIGIVVSARLMLSHRDRHAL